ncbi:hypothetical protein L596_010563 [Steinernema carpocapsae]|uniref:Uncharacterized protein n=1 Tax=Steinernema carpocapsae TaxID=34508 RepID=A0A4U5PIQ2_STECR|nr:hypothetical protein L596_010563 [Steinernema carpocapsae]
MFSPLALLVLGAVVASALAHPYGHDYHPGSEYKAGDYYDSDAKKYGYYDKDHEGHKKGYKYGDYGHYNGDYEHGDHDYGKKGYYGGDDYYKGAATGGHKHVHGEHADRDAKDADGYKKYSYYSEGNGPDGYYKKGTFGSEGYDSEHGQKHESKKAHGEGYYAGHHAGHKEHAGKHSDYQKAGGAKGYYGKGHEQHEGGYKNGEYAHAKHGDGHHQDHKETDYKYGKGHEGH